MSRNMKTLTLTLEGDVYDALQALAQDADQSVAAYLTSLIRQARGEEVEEDSDDS